jgi:ketosteroid isomerase-like protein
MNRKLTVIAFSVCALAAACGCIAVRGAGTNATEEAAIRKIIAAQDAGTRAAALPDGIFWSGAYMRPIVGGEKPDLRPGPLGVANRVPGSQKVKTEVIRVVVSDSGDLAYEYGRVGLEFDRKDGGHAHIDAGQLVIWQKQDGQWKVAAAFQFPYDQQFAEPNGVKE